MEDLVATLKTWQLHPIINHFTIAILTIAILSDLISSIFSSRTWMRHMALSLTVLGAGSAALSWVTGDWEADRIQDLLKTLQGPAKDVFQKHAQWGEILMYVFAFLAVWRIVSQGVSFFAASRPLYLLAGLIAIVMLFIQGFRGGRLVFNYGVGTQLLASSPTASASTIVPTPSGAPGGIPTVYVPAASPTPAQSSPTATPTISTTSS
jgi:uncharacterized membrane protein